MTKKLHIKTWGCQMNEYDSSKMADLLDATHGYQLTEVAEEADVLLLNTCSIREKAQEKVFHQLGRWKLLKEKNPDLIIGVGGCVASQEGDHIRQRAHYVDIIFGPQTLHRLPEMINAVRGNRSPVVDISFPEIEKFDRLPEPRAEGPTAFVSIMEGCNKYCTYCVVPYTRGEEVSRPCDDILFEIAQLAAQGVREVNLLGQNVNAWRGENYDGTTGSFADLLRLVAAIDGIDRIRFTTSHPIEFTDDIIEVYRDTPELVSFLHLPVQSGSDRVLNLMGRTHTALEYKAIIRKLREARPDIQISSDFIVGFPGETTDDFEKTMKLIADVNFDMSYSFIFSARPRPIKNSVCIFCRSVSTSRRWPGAGACSARYSAFWWKVPRGRTSWSSPGVRRTTGWSTSKAHRISSVSLSMSKLSMCIPTRCAAKSCVPKRRWVCVSLNHPNQ